MLHHNTEGHFRFLQGIEPYSCGVIADENYELVRVTMLRNTQWEDGFNKIYRHLSNQPHHMRALASIELRSPKVRTMQEFVDFNSQYMNVINKFGLLANDLNPIARTNVVPDQSEITETTVHAFSYTRRRENNGPKSFVVAGSGELRGSDLNSMNIVRRHDTSQEGLKEKVVFVRDVMSDRLSGLGVSWSDVTSISIYTVQPVNSILNESLRHSIRDADRFGLQVFFTRPPVYDIEFEMDARGVYFEELLSS